MRLDPIRRQASRQRGIALLAGLVLLSALSLLALIAANSMVAQQRMAGHFEDAETARANAEWALVGGLNLLRAMPDDLRLAGCDRDCFATPANALIHPDGILPPLPEFEPGTWWQGEGLLPGTDPVTATPPSGEFGPWAEPPRFTIEELAFQPAAELLAPPEAPSVDGIGYYRVLGRGTGRQATAVAVSETIVARPWTGLPQEGTRPADWTELCAPFRPWYHCGQMVSRARR